MKIELPPCELTASNVSEYRVFLQDPANVSAARLAASAVMQALARLNSNDLLRRAFNLPDGKQWLADVAQTAGAIRELLRAEQDAVDALMVADAEERNRFDTAAMRLSEKYANVARDRADFAASQDAADEGLISSLAKAGLSGDEIALTVAHRNGAGNPAADQARADAAAADASRAAFDAFLADPLRPLDALGDALAAELVALQGGIAAFQGDGLEYTKEFYRDIARKSEKRPSFDLPALPA